MQERIEEEISDVLLEDVVHNSMIPYAEYVLVDRALPRVEDGLKPVQRRILFTMHELGLFPDKPHKKSARIVGDCMGKYHPHGDSSVYDTMVRMAQPFRMGETLVDGHGNFGSIDGDSAAAMRYTEARMAALATEMMRDLDKDTVDWQLNFDDTLKEPRTLPCRFPNLLVNGAQGIAVGLSTDIPPHNITEVIDGVVAYIDNKRITLSEMMEIIQAPDFPTGGYIIKSDDIYKGYETGVGKVTVRAKMHVERDGQKKNIVITEMPYGENKAALLTRINDVKEGKKEGKKEDKKREFYSVISDIVDESDRNGMRAVIKLKREADVNAVIAGLLKDFSLQKNVSINMNAVLGGKPMLLGLMDIIKHYTEYQRKIIYNRTRYDLNIARNRVHILEGLVIAIEDIMNVVKLIKSSPNNTESKARLRDKYNLSEKQAQAVLDMKLQRLCNLEHSKLVDEIKELRIKIEEYESIVANRQKQLAIVKKEILAIKKQYKRPRKSEIRDSSNIPGEVNPDVTAERKGVVVLTQSGNIKFLSKKGYATTDKSAEKCEYGDAVLKTFEYSNEYNMLGFTDFGRAVPVSVNNLTDDKWMHKGTSLRKIWAECDKNERLIALFTEHELKEKKLIMFTSGGKIKRASASEYAMDKAYAALTLPAGEKLVSVETEDENLPYIAMATKKGKIIRFLNEDLPEYGVKAGGVKGMTPENDEIIYAAQTGAEGELIVVTDKGYAKKILLESITPIGRGGKGCKLQDTGGKSGNELKWVGVTTGNINLLLLDADGNTVVLDSDDIILQNTVKTGYKAECVNTDTIIGVRPHCV